MYNKVLRGVLLCSAVAVAFTSTSCGPVDSHSSADVEDEYYSEYNEHSSVSFRDSNPFEHETVYFPFNSSSIVPREETHTALRHVVEYMHRDTSMVLVVEGHCDVRGTREYNIALGERRASSVREYLVSQGVAKERIEVRSRGKEKPMDMGNDEAAHSKNRRVVFFPEGYNPEMTGAPYEDTTRKFVEQNPAGDTHWGSGAETRETMTHHANAAESSGDANSIDIVDQAQTPPNLG